MVSLGFYHKQLSFYVGIIMLVLAIGWTVKTQLSSAAGRPLVVSPGTYQVNVNLDVQDYGQVLVNSTPVKGVVEFLGDHDEFKYLLLDAPATDVPSVTATVTFPRSMAGNIAQATAIIVHNPTVEYTAQWQDDKTVVYNIPNVTSGATVTLVVQLPKGIVEPSFSQKIFGTINTFPHVLWATFAIVLPLLTLIIMMIVLLSNLRKSWVNLGSQERPTPPDQIAPAVAAVCVDGRMSVRAMAATLLDLARRDYIDIGSHDQTFTFTKRRRLLSEEDIRLLAPYEKALLEKIFTEAVQANEQDIHVRIGSSLFSRKVAEVYLGVYQQVTQLGYFVENPTVIQGTYRLAGLILFFIGLAGLGFGAFFFSNPPFPLLAWVGMILTALVVITMAPRMPAHTSTGIEKRHQWLEFRNYLKSSKEIDFEGQNQEKFFEYLPYAVAMGVEIEWARRFGRAPFHIPDWYTPRGVVTQMADFVNDIFPMVGYLAHELTAVKEPTLS